MYLVVTLTHDLSWSQHVATIISKAHQRLGFIRHNLRGSPYKCRETAFIALTRSQLEYCFSIWDPILNKDSDSIEKVQRKAARWARGMYGSVSVTQLLKDLKWRPLADLRCDHRIILSYKILHGSVNTRPPPPRPWTSENQKELLELLEVFPTQTNLNVPGPRGSHHRSGIPLYSGQYPSGISCLLP